jgi:hypothetical protein
MAQEIGEQDQQIYFPRQGRHSALVGSLTSGDVVHHPDTQGGQDGGDVAEAIGADDEGVHGGALPYEMILSTIK